MSHSTRLALATFAFIGSVTLANAQTAPMPTMPMTPPAGAPAAGGPGAMPMMDMGKMAPGGARQTPPMMEMMQMMRGAPMMSGMMPFDHVEGRIAFLKAELDIADAQLPQWTAFANVLRADANSMREGMGKMLQAGMPMTAPARTEAMVQMMTMRLEGMKSIVSAELSLYAVLTDAQKKLADELMVGPMGRM
jgi:hypothetical protein